MTKARLAPVLAVTAAALAWAAPAPSATTASPRCHTADLRIRAGVPNGAAGSVIVTFFVRNTGRHTCHTRGYPGFLLVSRTGRALPTYVTRDAFVPARRITLRRNQIGRFLIAFHPVDSTRGGRSCGSPVARFVHIIPPDERTFRSVSLRGPGISPCHGQVHERPMER